MFDRREKELYRREQTKTNVKDTSVMKKRKLKHARTTKARSGTFKVASSFSFYLVLY